MRALVQPARRHLGTSRNTHFHLAGVSQIHVMRLKTIALAPLWFAARTLVKMALLRAHDAGVGLRQAHEMIVTKTLPAFLGLRTAVLTKNTSGMLQANRFIDQRVQGYRLLTH